MYDKTSRIPVISGVTRGGQTAPGWHPALGDTRISQFLRQNLQKNTGETITWKSERVGVVTMNKKVIITFEDDD